MSENDLPELLAGIVTRYVDEQFGELDTRLGEIEGHVDTLLRSTASWGPVIQQQQAMVGGLRDRLAEIDGEMKSTSSNVPEHLYRQFIRSEAERLRIVKARISPSPDATDDSSQ